MKKIGIITIIDYNNYGNRLQNYASQEVLKSIDFHVETILNYPTSERTLIERFNKLVTTSPIVICEIMYNKIQSKLNKNKLSTERINVFKNFTSTNIVETDFTITRNSIPTEDLLNHDFFVVGSDQVWNPHFRSGFSVDFLTFVPREKRIAYAPSFGVSEIPELHVANYRKWLTEMNHLSVREQAGAILIKNLTGRDALVLVDPTLMLTKEKWLSISKVHVNKPKKDYLLTYFLGGISDERQKIISNIAKENNLEIVNLAQLKDKKYYTAGPSEFIDYIHSARVLLTDSFHGAVFSILLSTPFVVYNRDRDLQSMNSRIDTLLSTFKLESRVSSNVKNNDQLFEADYTHVPPLLEEERQKALNYLKHALNVKGE